MTKPHEGRLTLGHVEVDGTSYDHISAIGIGHMKQDLVLVQVDPDTGKDVAIEVGTLWETLIVHRKVVA